MPNFIYTKDIPDAANNPSNDQAPMEVNTNSIFDLIRVDHHGFNDNLGGYHTIIHQDAQLADPAAIPGPPQINQLYTKSIVADATGAVADTQLFSRTALGGISQLTGNHAAIQGYQWIGGVLLQWGFVTPIVFVSTTVTFKDRDAGTGTIPFPNACFCVLTTPFATANAAPLVISITSVSATQFTWEPQPLGFSAAYTGFYWIAIGN